MGTVLHTCLNPSPREVEAGRQELEKPRYIVSLGPILAPVLGKWRPAWAT